MFPTEGLLGLGTLQVCWRASGGLGEGAAEARAGGQEGREEDGRLWGLGPYKSPMWLKVKVGKVSLEDGYENWGLIK